MARNEFRTRAVLAPTMLAGVALVYWLDMAQVLGIRRGVLSAAVLGLLGIAGVFEFIALLRGGGFAVSRRSLPLFTVLLFGSAFLFAWKPVDPALFPLVIATLVMLFPMAVRSLGRDDMKSGLEKQGATLLGFIYIAWPVYLAMGTCLRHLPSVLYVVLVCKGGDIGGYCVGRLLGRHKLIPHVSPGKTVEGALGSLGASMLLAVLLRGPLIEPDVVLSLGAALGAGAALNFTTQTGDLIESLLKRRCGAKDSSNLLPAHGGVLDLVDSLLFSFCVWFQVLVWAT
jgi:phosphatidate cytidylyltransferase